MTTVEYRNDKVVIEGIVIDNSLFDEEKVGYKFILVDDEIDELYRMISECGCDRKNDKILMKEDQDFLKSIEDEFVFSSISTNEFVAQSISVKHFNDICADILLANGNSEDEVKNLISFEKERGRFSIYFLGSDIEVEIDSKILTGEESDHFVETLTQSIMNGDDSGDVSFNDFTYWWKKKEFEQAIGAVYEITQHEIHGERLCSFGLFTDREDALRKAIDGFEKLYTDFEVSISKNGENQWFYHGVDRSNGVDADFMFCIAEITLNEFGEL